ncbi:hypothetical protein GobsT_63940 [Gemmata obscuriglobus]|uniref:hypothetical protein n=1 Tax=Gemmata obscuriglobus TaxID=114 RepID=UPI00016C47CF|nr:hypothetical protein [Gemmata obscuriglobus]QEG31572.1 hypothetical protein GobsT_63940 [Gemmata obscuriglobus]VTS10914.1 Putative uncharacterized protein OS=Rhodopirellula baltica (strain SH1) GN=RB1289 PE=4 SV=1 [Gemmata obscuriglobus UQM 2246]
MAADEVVPHIGIRSLAGMVRLGMTRAEVQPLLDQDRDIRVDFRGDPPVVAFVESPKHWGSFEGIDLFEAGADEVIAEIAERLGLAPEVYRPGRHSYYFPDLRMGLWRSCVSDEDGDQGFTFDSVSVHAPGYYDPTGLAFIRHQGGLPPEQRHAEPGAAPDTARCIVTHRSSGHGGAGELIVRPPSRA